MFAAKPRLFLDSFKRQEWKIPAYFLPCGYKLSVGDGDNESFGYFFRRRAVCIDVCKQADSVPTFGIFGV